jgi:cation diffusion facilitator CzcD-associated flavoprotein CzcO
MTAVANRSVDRAYDVAVVGGGAGGIYGVHRLRAAGLDAVGIEEAPELGGVWYHNAYPGARVDVDSLDYCYYFSPEIWKSWRWKERYAGQPDLFEYLNVVADTYQVRDHYLLSTRMTGARWDEREQRYRLSVQPGGTLSARFLVMATGQLTEPRAAVFAGLERFRGEVLRTSRWPKTGVDLSGLTVGVIGTGSSGVQAVPLIARQARQLYVFQRTPHYAVPAQNRPLADHDHDQIAARVPEEREHLLTHSGTHMPLPTQPLPAYSRAQQLEMLEAQWERGGQSMNALFTDQGRVQSSNDVVAGFVRSKIRERVKDARVAEKLCPKYPIGTHRLALDIDFYETFNDPGTTLVDLLEHPIAEITEHGIRTTEKEYRLDVIVLALGFNAFTGSIERSHVRNGEGRSPTDGWARGPRTLLGVMTSGFPNFFFPTGPGSPSVLGNMILQNEFEMDWIADCLTYMGSRGFSRVEPTIEAEARWTDHVAECARDLLRRQEDNYMVHVNRDDGTRIFIPYTGGFGRYVEHARRVADEGYAGFAFDKKPA